MIERSIFLHKNEQNFNSDIRRISYQKNGMEISYPEIISGGSDEQRSIWNDIIQSDLEEIIEIYSVPSFPGLNDSLAGNDRVRFHLDYEIKLNNNQILSILYKAEYFNPYSAYPTDLIYTTNIDKRKNKRLRLMDLMDINLEFVKNFRYWDLAHSKERSYKYMDVVRTYRNSLRDDDLLKGFLAADQIGSNNIWQVYSYMTPLRLGISIYAPNYIGDHVEFERSFRKLQGFLAADVSFQNEQD